MNNHNPYRGALDHLQSDALSSMGLSVLFGAVQFYFLQSCFTVIADASPFLALLFSTFICVNIITLILALNRAKSAAIILAISTATAILSSWLRPPYLLPLIGAGIACSYHFYLFVWVKIQTKKRVNHYLQLIKAENYLEFWTHWQNQDFQFADQLIDAGLYKEASLTLFEKLERPLFRTLILADSRCIEGDQAFVEAWRATHDQEFVAESLLDSARPIRTLASVSAIVAQTELNQQTASLVLALHGYRETTALDEANHDLLFKACIHVCHEDTPKLFQHLASETYQKFPSDYRQRELPKILTEFSAEKLLLTAQDCGLWVVNLIETEVELNRPEEHWALLTVFDQVLSQLTPNNPDASQNIDQSKEQNTERGENRTTEPTVNQDQDKNENKNEANDSNSESPKPLAEGPNQALETARLFELLSQLSERAVREVREVHDPGSNMIADDIVESWQSLNSQSIEQQSGVTPATAPQA